jgi:hypothetical protein
MVSGRAEHLVRLSACASGVPKADPHCLFFSASSSGAESATLVSLRSVRSGGCLLLIGMGGAPTMSLPISTEVLVREVDVRGIFRYASTYPTAIAMTKKVDVSKLITHRIALRREATVTHTTTIEPRELGPLDAERLLIGFETARSGRGNGIDAIKVMFAL